MVFTKTSPMNQCIALVSSYCDAGFCFIAADVAADWKGVWRVTLGVVIYGSFVRISVVWDTVTGLASGFLVSVSLFRDANSAVRVPPPT